MDKMELYEVVVYHTDSDGKPRIIYGPFPQFGKNRGLVERALLIEIADQIRPLGLENTTILVRPFFWS